MRLSQLERALEKYIPAAPLGNDRRESLPKRASVRFHLSHWLHRNLRVSGWHLSRIALSGSAKNDPDAPLVRFPSCPREQAILLIRVRLEYRLATLPLSAHPIGVRSICQGTNQLGTVRELSKPCGFELPSPLEPTSKFRTIHRPPAGRDQQVILFVNGAPSSSPSTTPFFISDQAPVCLVGLPCFSFYFLLKIFQDRAPQFGEPVCQLSPAFFQVLEPG